MSIYENPNEYATITMMPIEIAMKRCEHFKKIQDDLKELSKCPVCNNYTLAYDSGEWESGIKPYVYCENEEMECEFAADGDFRNLDHQIHSDFDVVLMFAGVLKNEGLEETEKQLGTSWCEFISKEAASL